MDDKKPRDIRTCSRCGRLLLIGELGCMMCATASDATLDYNIDGKTISVDEIIPDLVNHPPHYTAGGVETIDFIEAKGLNYHLGNAVKYISRARLKGDPLGDAKKAIWYLERFIKNGGG